MATGLESLAIFGIACNVMQTINFAQVAIATYKQIREDGRIDPQLHKAASELRAEADRLSMSFGGNSDANAELIEAAKDCSSIAQKMVEELDKLGRGATGRQGVRNTLRLGIKTFWNRNKIENLEEEMSRVQAAMESRILMRTCLKVDALNLQQQNAFSAQSTTLQTFIAARAREIVDLKDLITSEARLNMDHSTRQHKVTREESHNHTSTEHAVTRKEVEHFVKSEHSDTKATVADHVTKEKENMQDFFKKLAVADNGKVADQVFDRLQSVEAGKLAREEQLQLLSSLDFPGRAWRMNDIKDAHCHTFQWLFGDLPKSSEPEIHLNQRSDIGESDETYKELVRECKERTWDRFTDWLSSDEKMYWIKAKAGAGKSTLMKFLCEDPRTQQRLSNNGSRPVIIITHSFFLLQAEKAPIQCNINGLLCNIIYQLVSADMQGMRLSRLTEHLFESRGRGRPVYGDWGRRQYQDACWKLLELASKFYRVCLFLDGLDEVHPSDGKYALLELLMTLKTDFALKMCVSSRPEVEFEQELSSYPTLTLHNLTAGDMYLYALNILSSRSESFSEKTILKLRSSKQRFASMIVYKADGVFLWADIAIQSLKRGATNGDDVRQLEHRLRQMPKELDKLFASMWDRLGDDKHLYGSEVALYFNLVLEWSFADCTQYHCCCNSKHGNYAHSRGHDQFCDSKLWREATPLHQLGMPLFHLALAKRESCTAIPRAWNNTFEVGSLWADCRKLIDRLPILSAGLLEFSGSVWRTSATGVMVANPEIGVCFIHRTAKEFFTDSIEGQKILQLDKLDFDIRFSATLRAVLSRGLVCNLKPLASEPFLVRDCNINTYAIAGCLHRVTRRVGRKASFQDTLACQIYHDSDVMVVHKHTFAQLDFLGIAVARGLLDYVVDVFDKPSAFTPEYKAYLLCASTSSGNVSWDGDVDVPAQLKMINYLLAQGCCHLKSGIVSGMKPYKSTGLEQFWHTIRARGRWPTSFCDSVIDTLHHFARSGADFMRPLYTFHSTALNDFSDYDPGWEGSGNRHCVILVKWSILGAMAHFALGSDRSWLERLKTEETHYIRCRLAEFVQGVMVGKGSLKPIAVAVALADTTRCQKRSQIQWMQAAKCVPNDKGHLIIEHLSHANKLDDNIRAHHKRGLERLQDSIVCDNTITQDVTEYLLHELGFAQSWPRAFSSSLYSKNITLTKDRKRLVDGEIYPPVKYLDQPT